MQYTVNVEQFYDKYLNNKSDIKRFVEDLASICKDDGADTVNLTKLQAILTGVEPIFKVFGEKNRADLLVRDFAKAHGLLSQTPGTKKVLVEQIGRTITTPMPEDAEERKYLDKLAEIAARPATAIQSPVQSDSSAVVHTERTAERYTISKPPEVDFGHGRVQMVRVTPEVVRDLPLLFAQGYGQDKRLLSRLRQFAAAGEDALGAAFVGPRRTINWLFRRREDIGAKAADYQVDKAEDMLAALESMGVEKVNVVATSEGALKTMIAVSMHPEKFQKVILVHPAGMDNKGFFRTHGRVAWHYARDIVTHPKKYVRLVRSKLHKQQTEIEVDVPWLKNVLTKQAERFTVASSKYHELAAQLQQAHPHLQFLFIADEGDKIYPPKRLKKVNPTIRVVASKWGGHGIRDQQSVDEIVGYLREMGTAE